jgi:chorismate mutase
MSKPARKPAKQKARAAAKARGAAAQLAPKDTARLRRMRDALDALNLRALDLMDARKRAVAAVLEWKAARGLPPRDRAREREMLAEVVAAAGKKGGLSKASVAKIFGALFDATYAEVSRARNAGRRS